MDTLDFTAKRTILVVDDTPDNLSLMHNLLKDDYQVKIAHSGEKALSIALSDSPPALILLDIMMPDLDGFEVCRRLKLDPKARNIPVIFLTAKAEPEDEKKGLELGAVDYITKPISPSIVMARVKNHLALQERNIELAHAKIVAEKANLAKSTFLSSMSHELRSPLNAILGFGQLMESDSPPPTPVQKENIAQILKAGWHLLKLINEILDLAKVESGQVPLSQEPVSLAEVMLECQSMVEPQLQQYGSELILPNLDNPNFVMADRTRLKQVLINLLSNAIKYNSKRGTVAVKLSATTPDRLRISICDSGVGLAPEKVAQLFQPFNRLGQEAGTTEGTGIGLVVAKRLVELMDGVIGVESTPGTGSIFWFELNTVVDPVLVVDEIDPLSASGPRATSSNAMHTLLYIEDNQANMKLVEQIVTRLPNVQLLTAANGTLGIEIARQALPDVILMDVNLPGISGFEALTLLQADPATASIPVIAVSANAMQPDIEKGIRAGFFRYITKPIQVGEFMQALDVALVFVEHQTKAVIKEV